MAVACASLGVSCSRNRLQYAAGISARRLVGSRWHSAAARTAPRPITWCQARKQPDSAAMSLIQLVAPVLPLFLASLPAYADERGAGDAAAAAINRAGNSTDLLVSVLFGIVVLLLTIVTGGVIYLQVKSWLDDRQEKQDKETIVKLPAAASSSSAADSSLEEIEKKRVRIKREKRGFGNY